MKLLTVDIGNSYTKFALFEKDKLLFKSSRDNTEFIFPESADFDEIAVSSVVPKLTDFIVGLMIRLGKARPLIINSSLKLNYEFNYGTPEILGIDRVCGTAGLIDFAERTELKDYKTIFYTDLGTATTINIVSENKFIGGLIAPGVNTMFKSLKSNTAQLPDISMDDFKTLIGKSTKTSIASGVLAATTGMIEKIYNNLYSDESNPPAIVITGGNADLIKKHLSIKTLHAPNLVLNGIKKIHELNNE